MFMEIPFPTHPLTNKPPVMIKARIFLVCSILIIRPLSSISCGNEYYQQRSDIPIVKGKLQLRHLLFHDGEVLPYWYQRFGDNVFDRRGELAKKIKPGITGANYLIELSWADLESALNRNVDYKLLSDFAWHELRVGNKDNAVKLLEALYEKHPNEYNIVANLGTAYEVTGKNEMALALLKKAVAINPASHHGSEWIHVKILEQKVNAKPDYKHILDLKSGNNFTQWLSGSTYDKSITPDSLMIQLAYQLHERISFISDPDPVVGQLLFDFADLVAISRSISEAKPFYRYAVTYDSSLISKEKERILIGEGEATEAVETTSTDVVMSSAKKPVAATSQWIYIAVVTVVVGAVALYLVSRKKKASV
jgi:tetratricopeptide (TPR) repeat protein